MEGRTSSTPQLGAPFTTIEYSDLNLSYAKWTSRRTRRLS